MQGAIQVLCFLPLLIVGVLMSPAAMAEREYESFHWIVTTLGGWPVIDRGWHDSQFDLTTLLSNLRSWYEYTPLVRMSVTVDERNSSAHRIKVGLRTNSP